MSVVSTYTKDASRDAVAKLRLDGTPTPRSWVARMTKRPDTIRCRAGAPLRRVGIWRIGHDEATIVPSSDQDKRLRAELAEGLGYFPATLAAENVARYREQIAQRKAREEAGIREGDHEHRWDHLREEKRRAEVEAQRRASVADLYE